MRLCVCVCVCTHSPWRIVATPKMAARKSIVVVSANDRANFQQSAFRNLELLESKHRYTFPSMGSIPLALSQGSLCPCVSIWLLDFSNSNVSCLRGLVIDPLSQTSDPGTVFPSSDASAVESAQDSPQMEA